MRGFAKEENNFTQREIIVTAATLGTCEEYKNEMKRKYFKVCSDLCSQVWYMFATQVSFPEGHTKQVK
jgi:hypothetical protein